MCSAIWYVGRYLHFYKTDKELNIYKESNIIDLTKEAVMNILTEIGYVEEFNDKVRFSFDSDENVQRKYLGTMV